MVKCRALLLVMMLSVISVQAAFATITATVDERTIDIGDSIELIIKGNDIAKNAAPDLSDVIDNFDLLRSAQTQAVTVINGKMTNEIIWTFTLAPKHAGKVTIPAISVGQERTQSISINVKDSTPTTAKATQTSTTDDDDNIHSPAITRPDVFVKAELSPAAPYVQSQALYKLRLFYNRQIANPQLAEPTASGVEFVRLSQSKAYQEEINNQSYQVIEIDYAAFPKRSGNINIPGPVFVGGIVTDNVNNFMTPNSVKPVRVMANSLQMDVQPIPAVVKEKKWLPAAEVKLTETWSTDTSQFQVGVPITRTVTLTAKGVDEKQLPALLPTDSPNFQLYPDKPDITADTDGQNVFATRIEKAGYMPTHAGITVIPAITVQWWNTRTNKTQTATIPAKTITIAAAAGDAASNKSSATASAPLMPTVVETIKPDTVRPTTALWTHATTWMEQHPWFAVVILAPWILLPFLFVYFWQRDKKRMLHLRDLTQLDPQQSEQQESLRQARQRVESAVKAHDPHQFATALINLARCYWDDPTILSLPDVAAHCKTEEAKRAIQELDKLRYSYVSGKWQAEQTGKVILQEFKKSADITSTKPGGLPALYPSNL